MAKRIVEYVGIGDCNPSAQLEIAPQHADDVALKISGTKNGTQTGNMIEAYDSAGTLLAKLDINGAFQCVSLSGSVSGGSETVTGLLSAAGIQTPSISAVAVSATTITGSTIYGASSIASPFISGGGINTPALTAVSLSAGTIQVPAFSIVGSATPTTSGDPAATTMGTIWYDDNYIYVKTAASSGWKRVAIAGW